MSFQNYKIDFHYVGGRHRSATKNISGDITSKVSKVLIGYCSICNRKKSRTVSNKTKQAESFGASFKISGKKKRLNMSNKVAKKILIKLRRALDITANLATTAASRNPKNVLSTIPEVINFYHTGRGFYLGKFV